jgi:hypothetical protein
MMQTPLENTPADLAVAKEDLYMIRVICVTYYWFSGSSCKLERFSSYRPSSTGGGNVIGNNRLLINFRCSRRRLIIPSHVMRPLYQFNCVHLSISDFGIATICYTIIYIKYINIEEDIIKQYGLNRATFVYERETREGNPFPYYFRDLP